MAIEHNAPTSSRLRYSRDERERLESIRFGESGRRARVLLLTLIPIGIALAMILQYLEILKLLDESDWRYQIDRAPMDVFLRIVAPAAIAGAIATTGVTLLFTKEAEALAAPWRLLLIGIGYGVLLPVLIGVLMPLTVFVLSVTGLSRVTDQGSIEHQLAELVFSTPRSSYLGWLFGINDGLKAGLVLGSVGWAVLAVAGPITNPARSGRIVILAWIVGPALVALVFAGPISILEFLFDHFNGW